MKKVIISVLLSIASAAAFAAAAPTAETSKRGGIYSEYQICGTGGGCSSKQSGGVADSGKKYTLNNPFYQPQKGAFTTVTDFGYNINTIDFAISGGRWDGERGKYSGKTLSVAEHLAYGITEEVAVKALVRLASPKYSMTWNSGHPRDDQNDGPEVDLVGIGVQWRANNNQWITSLSGVYESMFGVASILYGDAKIGHKSDNTIVYGFGAATHFSWKNSLGYGVGLVNQAGDTILFTQELNVSSSTYLNIGGGVFTAFNSDWSVDGQLFYSYAQWHDQVAARLAVNFQPLKRLSLSLYGQAALIDSADKFNDSHVECKNAGDALSTPNGTAKFGNYSDLFFGLQITATF